MKYKFLVFVAGIGVMISSLLHGAFIGAGASNSAKAYSVVLNVICMATFGYFTGRIREKE